MTEISIQVNGREVVRSVEPRTHLADFLRDGLDLTATHVRCEQGVCGACTILLDGEPSRSCITYAVACQGAAVTTLEGLADDPVMNRLRQAFKAEHALQCGFCTPGMLVTARDIVTRLPQADEVRVRLELSGNLCRCTGYGGIVRAIMRVLDEKGPERGERASHKWLGPVGARGGASTVSIQTPIGFGVEQPVSAEDEEIGLAGAPPTFETEAFLRLAHDADQVWAALGDLERLVLCVPGASLREPPRDGRVRGRVDVKLGPLSTSFIGSGLFVRSEVDHTGRLAGSGQDQISRTKARGEIDFSVASGEEGTAEVRVRVRAILAGPLAQFGRSSLAQDVIKRLADEFARRLEQQLSGRPAPEAEAPLMPGSLLVQVILARLRGGLGRLIHGRRRAS